MNFPFFQKNKKNPLTKVSLKYAETKEEIHVELCHLAWQWTIGNATYDDAVDVIQEGKPFVIPKDDYAQLDVRDYRVYDGEKGRSYYWPDDEEGTPAIALRKGKFLGCICEGKNSVEDLADRDDAHIFIERLEQLHKMYAEVESGKKLPKEEPKKKEEGSDKKEKPESETEADEQEQKLETELADAVKAELGDFSSQRPLYDLWGKLTDDGVAAKLQEMTRADRESFFDELLAEYNAVMGKMQKYAEGYLGGMAFYATAVKSFNLEKSSAAKFLKELEDEQSREESQGQQPKKDKKQANYISRQLKNVNNWIKQAENDGDDFALELLRNMKEALKNGDSKKYDEIKKRYDRLVSADQQTNPKKDSSTDDTGKDEQTTEDSGSEEESKEGNPEDTTSDDETSSDDTSQEDSDKKYPIKDVIAWMQMVGVMDIPVILTMSSDQTKGISATWVNSYMESVGNDNRLAV